MAAIATEVLPAGQPSGAQHSAKSTLPNGLLVLTEIDAAHALRGDGGVGRAAGRATRASERRTVSPTSWSTWSSRGRPARSAQQIAREVDSLGGNLDAFTSKESDLRSTSSVGGEG